jgi:hypothetical protein
MAERALIGPQARARYEDCPAGRDPFPRGFFVADIAVVSGGNFRALIVVDAWARRILGLCASAPSPARVSHFLAWGFLSGDSGVLMRARVSGAGERMIIAL